MKARGRQKKSALRRDLRTVQARLAVARNNPVQKRLAEQLAALAARLEGELRT